MRRAISTIIISLILVCLLTLTSEVEPVRSNNNSNFLLETDKGIYKLGDLVTITFRNISNQTKYWSGNWPVPWDVYTYPEEEYVFQTVPCYCIFQISAGETITYKWNQSDMFTIGPVEPGDHIVRDNQDWGLSAHFKLIDVDILVPDDYSIIQEAIDAASDGDTIFVRNGTYYENVVVNKPVLLMGENREGTIVDGNGSAVFRLQTNNITVTPYSMALEGFLQMMIVGIAPSVETTL